METTIEIKEKLIEHHPLDGTPFTITGNEEKGYFLRIADYKLTDTMPTTGDLLDEMDLKQWQIIFNLICTLIEINERSQQITNNHKNQ